MPMLVVGCLHAKYYEWQVIVKGYWLKVFFINWKSNKALLMNYCANLDEESSDEDEIPEGDFTNSDGQQMLIDCDMLMGKGLPLCDASTVVNTSLARFTANIRQRSGRRD